MSRDSIGSIFRAVMNDVDEDLKDFQPLNIIAKPIKVRPAYIAFIVTMIILILSILDFLAVWTTTAFGIIYPAYMTSINMKSGDERTMLKWKIYWGIFLFTTLFDSMFFFILYFIPAYYALKPLFYLWLFYPRSEGVLKIYDYVYTPVKKIIVKMREEGAKSKEN